MLNLNETKNEIARGGFDKRLERIYGAENAVKARKRYLHLTDLFEESFGSGENIRFFSAPGRTEICGNHTDHNCGKVFAAAINLDAVACASKTDENIIRVMSEGFPGDVVDLSVLSPLEEEIGKSAALIRGVVAGFKERGYRFGGFNCATVNEVLRGSGMSSSAAFEVLIGTALNFLYNGGKIPAVEIAKIGQYAENIFFGKLCGLMDQTVSAVGGCIQIDFENPKNPVITPVPFDLASFGHSLCIVDTGGSHADLTAEYDAIRTEMEAVAGFFGKKCLRQLNLDAIMSNIGALRKELGERPLLRAIHFFRDNERVALETAALEKGDFEKFKELVTESGRSSFMYNQNVYPAAEQGKNKKAAPQPLSLALCVSDAILSGKGAWRVHGGGFAGAIQAFAPFSLTDEYRERMDGIFGNGSCKIVSIRSVGGTEI